MRACFQGQNIIVLGNGIAKLQSLPLVMDAPEKAQKPNTVSASSKPPSKSSHQ
jgi:hypothetical protein